MDLMIITGRSGSGKTVALRVLEDLGYYCVDNIPVQLLNELIRTLDNKHQPIAISIDIRNLPQDPTELIDNLLDLPDHYKVTIIYIDASTQSLIKRYSETRRLHPLSRMDMSLEEAICTEKERLLPLKTRADLVIDTTNTSIHDLSQIISTRVLGHKEKDLLMVFESFGFKYGVPTDADFIYDVRFLPNPHWDPTLRPFTGLDQPVIDYLNAQPDVQTLIKQIEEFIQYWLPALERNNRSYVTIAIGCTGGQHRSVFIVEQLSKYFINKDHNVQTRHRTLEKK